MIWWPTARTANPLNLEEAMISLEEILNIICTEAIEHGGVQEVPDHKHGAQQQYHSPKHDARAPGENNENPLEPELPPIRYDLDLIEDSDGTLHWED